MKLIQVYDKLDRLGGAQLILYNLYSYFKSLGYNSIIMGGNKYNSFVFKEKVSSNEYLKFNLKNLFTFSNTIIISHSRKVTSILCLYNRVFRCNFKVIHISHNIFNDKRSITFFPRRIIGVSDSVKDNLINYFKIDQQRICVIHNGLEDVIKNVTLPDYIPDKEIKILFVGRIEKVKQQIKIVRNLNGKIKKNIQIHFAGSGSQEDELRQIIDEIGSDNFSFIGFKNNIPQLIEKYHYLMLFSEKEGLGLTLIEACMAGRPIITRGKDGCEACSEVCEDKYNGFIANDFESLLEVLNNLEYISKEGYYKLCVNARHVFENKFNMNIMLKKYKEIVYNIIDESFKKK